MSVIIPELQGGDMNVVSLLKEGTLKSFMGFHEHIPKETTIILLRNVIEFLKAESNTVHSYEAICIEKMLRPRYSAADVDPFLVRLIHYLFEVLQFSESQENPYVMKCQMRAIMFSNIVGDAATCCSSGLTTKIVKVCRYPRSPTFNHYFFEATAATIRRCCEKEPVLITVFENNLFAVLPDMMANDTMPYAFQIFALLVEMDRPIVPIMYIITLFDKLLNPDLWMMQKMCRHL